MVNRYDLLFSAATPSLFFQSFSNADCTTSRASSSCRRFLRMKRYTLSAYCRTHSLYSFSVKSRPPPDLIENRWMEDKESHPPIKILPVMPGYQLKLTRSWRNKS